MTEQNYIDALQVFLARRGRLPEEALDLAEQAWRAFRSSARITTLKGNVIQRKPPRSPYQVDNAVLFYNSAIEMDPSLPEPCDGMASYAETIMHDADTARRWRRRAEELRQRR